MMYEVTNVGAASRTFHDVEGRAVTIRGGDTRPVLLTERQRDRISRDNLLRVRDVAGEEPVLPAPPPPDAEKTRAEQARELLEISAGKLFEFSKFASSAKALLAERWPRHSGMPKKSTIRQLLAELAEQEE